MFASHAHRAAWAGLCPGNNESGGRRRSGRARKGNPALRRVLVECAHAASRTKDCQFHSHFPRPHGEEELQAGRLRHRPQAGPRDPCGPEEPEACTDPGTDCREIMARRNAPRWIRMMKAYGIEQPAAGQAATQPA